MKHLAALVLFLGLVAEARPPIIVRIPPRIPPRVPTTSYIRSTPRPNYVYAPPAPARAPLIFPQPYSINPYARYATQPRLPDPIPPPAMGETVAPAPQRSSAPSKPPAPTEQPQLYGLAHRHFASANPEELIYQLRAVKDDDDWLVPGILAEQKTLRARYLDPEEKAAMVCSDARLKRPRGTVYALREPMPKWSAVPHVEDRLSFNNVDFQANPSEGVNQLNHNPAVGRDRLRKAQTRTFRPGKVYSEKKASKKTADSSPSVAKKPSRSRSRWDLRREASAPRRQPSSCDRNRDGRISGKELQRCRAT